MYSDVWYGHILAVVHQAFETPADPIFKSQMYTPEAEIFVGNVEWFNSSWTDSCHWRKKTLKKWYATDYAYINLVEFKLHQITFV